MKRIFFYLIAFTSIIQACTPKAADSKNENEIEIEFEIVPGGLLTTIDTARLLLIDSMVYTIDTTANNSGAEVTLHPNRYSEKDIIRYFEKDSILWRMVVTTFRDTLETRSIFYWKDGKQQFIRHREWRRAPHPSPMSKEVLTYFEDGKIVAIVDRTIALREGEPPSALYPVPLAISARKAEEVVAEYSHYREPALKILEEQRKTEGK